MNEEKETNIETQEPQIPEDALPEEDEPEEMDLEEAKAIARLLAQAMIASEAPGQAAESADVPAATDTEIPDQAAESENTPADSDAKSSVPVWKRIFRKTVPSGRRFAIPIVIAEILMLTALVFVIGKYALFTSDDTVQFAQKNAADNVTCADGVLIYNDVRAKVPTDGNLKYNISYTWSEDDTEYPSVPRAALVSYMDKPENGTVQYEISLYRDSFTPKKKIPSGKDQSNWFSGWAEEKNYEVNKFHYKSGDIHGFCISNLHASHVIDDYRTYTYYFAIPESGGISVYVLEGTCYDPEKLEEFHKVIVDSIGTLSYEPKET